LNERIKKLRRSLDLTQQEFADRIGVKRNTVATYEGGRNEPVDSVVSLICREFGVREEWLRFGTGEMFAPAPTSELDALASKYPKMTHDTYVLIEKLLSMSVEDQNVITGFMRQVVAGIGDVPLGTMALHPARAEMGREDYHAEVDRRFDEEKEAADKSEA